MLSLLDADHPIYDTELLRQLQGRRLAERLQVLCVIGAHRFQEMRLINRIFPRLRHMYLFEPLPDPLATLTKLAGQDHRIRVFPVAIAERDGSADFHVTSNDGESSSLLAFGTHSELFPEVQVARKIRVPTRRLDSVIEEHGLEPPDVIVVDVQGAEFLVLRALASGLLARVRLIYAEVSTERVYESAGLLPDIEALLAPRFVNLGYAPLRSDVPMHGNAVFVARDDVEDALALTPAGHLHQFWRKWRRHRRGQRSQAPIKRATR
jgi:FkbM family methyltransferase